VKFLESLLAVSVGGWTKDDRKLKYQISSDANFYAKFSTGLQTCKAETELLNCFGQRIFSEESWIFRMSSAKV